MKKMLRLLVTICIGCVLVVAGLFAAATATHTSSFKVTFIANHAAVKIESGVGDYAASTQQSYQDGTPLTANSAPYTLTWDVGNDLVFDASTDEVVLKFKFTNMGSKTVNIAISTPTATNTKAEFTTAWKESNDTTARDDGLGIAENGVVHCHVTIKIPSDKFNRVENFTDTFTGATGIIFTINVA